MGRSRALSPQRRSGGHDALLTRVLAVIPVFLRNQLIVGISVGMALALASCDQISDGLVTREISSAKEPSDLFQAVCVKTKADTTQIRRLANSLRWEEKPLSQEQKAQKLTAMFGVPLNGAVFGIVTAQGFDPEWGRQFEMCMLSYGGDVEPDFISHASTKSGLRKVMPGAHRVSANNNQTLTLPSDAIVLTDTGGWGDANLLVVPTALTTFGLRSVNAIALKLQK